MKVCPTQSKGMFVSLTNNNVSKSVKRFPSRLCGVAGAVAMLTTVKGLQERGHRERETERERENTSHVWTQGLRCVFITISKYFLCRHKAQR